MSEHNILDPLASPCTKRCVIDATSGFCQGCFRTLDEIVAWSRIGDQDDGGMDGKRSIWSKIQQRAHLELS